MLIYVDGGRRHTSAVGTSGGTPTGAVGIDDAVGLDEARLPGQRRPFDGVGTMPTGLTVAVGIEIKQEKEKKMRQKLCLRLSHRHRATTWSLCLRLGRRHSWHRYIDIPDPGRLHVIDLRASPRHRSTTVCTAMPTAIP